MGAGAREAELPSCRSAITCPPLPGHPGTSAKNCDRRIFLKMNGMDFDLLGEARKPSRTFAISWDKLANDRVHLRSPGRSSQTIACICDLLGKARKRSRAFAISERCMEGMGTVDKAYSSTLIRVECRRFIDRMRLEHNWSDDDIALAGTQLRRLERVINRVRLSAALIERASGPMPTIINTLDAIHIATASALRQRLQPHLV